MQLTYNLIMMKRHAPTLIVLLIVSIIFVIMGYLIDDDPAYPNFWHTVFEFIMLTLIVFGVLNIVYWGLHLIMRLFPDKK